MTDQTTTTERPIRELLEELLTVEARMGSLAARGGELRTAIEARARAQKATDGVAPTYRAPGLGTASYSDPQPAIRVADPDAFASWAAQRYPDNVIAALVIGAADLDRTVEALTDLKITHTAAVTPRPAWVTEFLKGCACPDDAPSDNVFAPETGEHVDGMRKFEAAPGRLSVRLDAEAKARAAAELADPVAAGMLTAPIGQVVDQDRAREIRESTATIEAERAAAVIADLVEDLDAEGVPDYGPADPDDVTAPTPTYDEAELFGLVAGTTLEDLKVPALKDLCRERTLSVGGTKAGLIGRLRTFALGVPA